MSVVNQLNVLNKVSCQCQCLNVFNQVSDSLLALHLSVQGVCYEIIAHVRQFFTSVGNNHLT